MKVYRYPSSRGGHLEDEELLVAYTPRLTFTLRLPSGYYTTDGAQPLPDRTRASSWDFRRQLWKTGRLRAFYGALWRAFRGKPLQSEQEALQEPKKPLRGPKIEGYDLG